MTRKARERGRESIDTVRPPGLARRPSQPHASAAPASATAAPAPAEPTTASGRARFARPDLDALLDRAAMLVDAGQYESAARVALVCMEEAPLDVRGYLVCAIAQQALGRFGLAERLLRRVLLLDPGSAEARLRLELVLGRSAHNP